MNPATAKTLAQYLLDSARETKDFKHSFIAAYDLPPTAMNQVHHLRSVLQALIARDDMFELSERRAEFGRVEFTDSESCRFLLKSARAFAIEQHVEAAGQLELFPSATTTADVHVVVFDFHTGELRLHLAPAIEIGRKKEVRVVGPLKFCGRWPVDPIDFDSSEPFDQDLRDSFDEIGRENEEGGFGL